MEEVPQVSDAETLARHAEEWLGMLEETRVKDPRRVSHVAAGMATVHGLDPDNALRIVTDAKNRLEGV